MTDEGEAPERAQVWHRYRLQHGLNVAWLDYRITTSQIYALDDAWDVLVVRPEWREWIRAHRIPASPFLYLAVRDELPGRRLRKTRNGASLQLPFSEVAEAEAEGRLSELWQQVIHDVNARWAIGHGHPAPPG